jgi:hypothetical protein
VILIPPGYCRSKIETGTESDSPEDRNGDGVRFARVGDGVEASVCAVEGGEIETGTESDSPA